MLPSRSPELLQRSSLSVVSGNSNFLLFMRLLTPGDQLGDILHDNSISVNIA